MRIGTGGGLHDSGHGFNMRKICMIFTGGTIASLKTDKGLEPVLDAMQILSYLPEIDKDVELFSEQVCNLDSTDMDYVWWLKIAGTVEENYHKYDGFVICHGTDTMAYTAAALSYLIQNSDKPVVLTGSQQPVQMEITDARKNLSDSICYAADPRSRGVCLIFDGRVIAGTRAKKTSSFSYHAFSSINFPEIAQMRHGRIIRYIPCEQARGETVFYHNMNPRVFCLKLTPGISPAVLETVFEAYDCIVVESFGVGGIPGSLVEDLSRLMERSPADSRVIIMTTQVTYEGSNLSTYEVGQRIRGRFPFLEAYDMNFEAVFAKIMWIMGLGKLTFQEIERLFYSRINHDVIQ